MSTQFANRLAFAVETDCEFTVAWDGNSVYMYVCVYVVYDMGVFFPVSDGGIPGLIPGESTWGFWWTEWNREVLLFFPCQYIDLLV